MFKKGCLPLLFLALTALLLSSCRAVVETEVRPDGSGDLRSSVVFSAEEKANFEARAGNEGKTICDSLKQGSQVEAEFVEDVRDGETFCTTVRSFEGLRELRGYYGTMGNVQVNELRMALGEVIFDLQLDLTPKDGNEAAATEWRLTVPGEIGNHNADAVEGQTLIWAIEPGQVKTLHAESKVGLQRSELVLIGVGLLVLGIGVGVLLSRRRRNQG
jgi:hypothetical protein